MSNYPFGLRGDPFVPPATLSAKEASRLIRRRVRACNGDGGLLYPIDTCDAIHSLARGVPDAVLALAGKALAVAAAEGARAVSPAHVKRAAEATSAPSATEQGTAEAAESRPGATPSGDAKPVATAPPPAAPSRRDAAEAQPHADEDHADAPAASRAARARSKPDEPALSPEPLEAIDELDDDLPPFRPASVALPMQPSEDLPEEAREWVSRFISSQPPSVPVMPLSENEAPRVRHIPAPSEPPTPAPAARVPERREAEAVYAALSPPRGRRSRPARRQNASRTLIAVLGVVAVLAMVLRYSTPGHLAAPDSDPTPSVRTAAPPIEAPGSAHPPVVTVTPSEARDQASSHTVDAPPTTGPQGTAETPEPDAAQAPGSTPLVANAEPAKRTGASSKFALEVASFIFEDRARQERDRLVAAGLRARVVTTLEFGSRVYRVVIGGYPHPAAAERAADSLLSNGVVLQARVVSAHPIH